MVRVGLSAKRPVTIVSVAQIALFGHLDLSRAVAPDATRHGLCHLSGQVDLSSQDKAACRCWTRLPV
jgi:hypothetical protein